MANKSFQTKSTIGLEVKDENEVEVVEVDVLGTKRRLALGTRPNENTELDQKNKSALTAGNSAAAFQQQYVRFFFASGKRARRVINFKQERAQICDLWC
jgi:hypothetical protein